MRRYDLHDQAANDILDLGDFIRRYDEQAGDALVDALFDSFERLSEFPHLGPERPEFGSDMRCFHLNRQRVSVFYRAHPDARDRVIIVRVFRQGRDVAAADFDT